MDYSLWINRIGWTLFHSLWLFSLIALGAGLLARKFRAAHLRYRCYLLALIGFPISFLTTFLLQIPELSPFALDRARNSDTTEAMEEGSRPPLAADPELDQDSDPEPVPDEGHLIADTLVPADLTVDPPIRKPLEVEQVSQETRSETQEIPANQAALESPWSWAVPIWLMGVLLMSVRPLIGWRVIRKLRTRIARLVDPLIQNLTDSIGRELKLRGPVPIVESALIRVPSVIGWLRPLILMPIGIVARLTPAQLEAVLAHELAHVKRNDYLTNLIQTWLETIFFYHPGLWWLSLRLHNLREDCCDDLALRICSDRKGYVEMLMTIDEYKERAPRRDTVAVLTSANGGSLLSRIRRILGHRTPAVGGGLFPFATVSAVVSLMLGFLLTQSDETIAENQPKPARLFFKAPDGNNVNVVLGHKGWSPDLGKLSVWSTNAEGELQVGKTSFEDLERIPDGEQVLVARPEWPNVLIHKDRFPLTPGDHVVNLAKLPYWYDNKDGKRIDAEVSVHSEGLRQSISVTFTNNTGDLYLLGEFDLQLVGSGARVFPNPAQLPKDRVLVPGQKLNVSLNWTDLVHQGIWVSRHTESIDEPLVPAPEGSHGFRLGGTVPVVLIEPARIHELLQARKKLTAQITWVPQEYQIGENVLAPLALTNESKLPLEIDLGGDYQGSPRALRFKVRVVNSLGELVEDPYPKPMNMGGIGGSRVINPGETYQMSIPICRYARFMKTGEYRIWIYHDLGWDSRLVDLESNKIPDEGREAPVATSTVRFREPSDLSASILITKYRQLSRGSGFALYGDEKQETADMEVLRHPAYMPHLLNWISSNGGEFDNSNETVYAPAAVEGINSIETSEATRILLDLVRDRHPRIAASAADALLSRVPTPEWGHSRKFSTEIWTAELIGEVVNFALMVVELGSVHENHLTLEHRENRIRALRILKGLARRSDYTRLAKSIEPVLSIYKDDPTEQKAYPRPWTVWESYRDALWSSLSKREDKLSPEEADILTFPRLVNELPPEERSKWDIQLVERIEKGIPCVRANALLNFDRAGEKFFHGALIKTIREKEYPSLQVEAIHAAERSKSRVYIPVLREVLQGNPDQWIKSAAEAALKACDVPGSGDMDPVEQEPIKPSNPSKDQTKKTGVFKGKLLYTELLPQTEAGPQVRKEVGLENVFVYMIGRIPESEEPKVLPRPVLTLKDRAVSPHALIYQANQPLRVENGHPGPVRVAISVANWEHVLEMKGGDIRERELKPGTVPGLIQSEYIPELRGILLPLDHSYFDLTNENGEFEITGIPPGEWEFQFWHEMNGFLIGDQWQEGRMKLAVNAGSTTDLGVIKLDRSSLLPKEKRATPQRGLEDQIPVSIEDNWFLPDPFPQVGHINDWRNPGEHLRLLASSEIQLALQIVDADGKTLSKIWEEAQKQIVSAKKNGEPEATQNAIWTEAEASVIQLIGEAKFQRVREFRLQRKGYEGFLEPEVQEFLDLSESQKQGIKAAIEAHFSRIEKSQMEIDQLIDAIKGNSRSGLVINQVDELKEKIEAKTKMGQRSHYQVWVDLKNLLTPEQQALYQKKRGEISPEGVKELFKFVSRLNRVKKREAF